MISRIHLLRVFKQYYRVRKPAQKRGIQGSSWRKLFLNADYIDQKVVFYVYNKESRVDYWEVGYVHTIKLADNSGLQDVTLSACTFDEYE